MTREAQGEQRTATETWLEPRTSLAELAWVFLRLGTTAFGGPAVHVALMREEVVERRKWLSEQRFVDLYGATNLIPGPNSTELAIHLGLERGGVLGMLVAGTCFIVPAGAITLALAYAYVHYAYRPAFGDAFYGVKPALLAIVGGAIAKLAKPTLKTRGRAALGLALFVAALVPNVPELALLFGAGALGAIVFRPDGAGARVDGEKGAGKASPALMLPLLGAPAATAAIAPTTARLLVYFLKIGSVLYGSGYVLVAFLRGDLVERWHWLSEAQLVDLIAIGQFTPGPVFTTATAIGYALGGLSGAAAATFGIFFPSFVFVVATHKLIARLRESPTMSGFLDGVNVAAVALMAAVLVSLARAAVPSWPAAVIALAATWIAVRTKLNPTWLIVGGAIAGLVVRRLGIG
jgi:chromate transporter